MIDPALMRDLEVQLKSDEGHVLCRGRHVVYDDATGLPIVKGSVVMGNPTIAYGRELSMTGLGESEAMNLLDNNCIDFVQDCANRFAWFVSTPEQGQLVVASAAFNMGMPHFEGFHDTIGALAARQYAKAGDFLLDSEAGRKYPKRYGHYRDILHSLGS